MIERTRARATWIPLWAIAVLIGIPLGCFVTYRLLVPFGETPQSMTAFEIFSVRHIMEGPNGERVLVVVNDTGAAHSGPHYVWVFRGDSTWLWPIAVKGWTAPHDPKYWFSWDPDGTACVQLAATKRGDDWQTHRFRPSNARSK